MGKQGREDINIPSVSACKNHQMVTTPPTCGLVPLWSLSLAPWLEDPELKRIPSFMHGIIPFLSKDANVPTFDSRIQILLTCGPQGRAVLHGNLCIPEEFWSLPQTKNQGGIGSEWGFLQVGTMIGSKGLSQVPWSMSFLSSFLASLHLNTSGWNASPRPRFQ